MTRVEFKPSVELFPFQSRWFDSSAGRVHYVDEGAGRPILFMHANATWSFLYRGIISPLQDRFRCIAPDYRVSACRSGLRDTGIPGPSPPRW